MLAIYKIIILISVAHISLQSKLIPPLALVSCRQIGSDVDDVDDDAHSHLA